jgi:hypothetical protein
MVVVAAAAAVVVAAAVAAAAAVVAAAAAAAVRRREKERGKEYRYPSFLVRHGTLSWRGRHCESWYGRCRCFLYQWGWRQGGQWWCQREMQVSLLC